MYDMYPEWGPAKHRTEESGFGSSQSTQRSLDLRDNDGQHPDDN